VLQLRANAMLSRRRATAVISANWWDGGRLEHLVRPRFWLNHYGTITALYSLQRQNRSLLASEKKPIFTCPREKAALYSLQRQNRSLLAPENNRSLLAPERKLLFTRSRETTALYSFQERMFFTRSKKKNGCSMIQEKLLFIRFSTVPLFRGLTP